MTIDRFVIDYPVRFTVPLPGVSEWDPEVSPHVPGALEDNRVSDSALVASGAVGGSCARAKAKDPRTELLRQLSTLNAVWAERLVRRGAGTDSYVEPQGGEPYLRAVRGVLAGEGVVG